MAYASWEEHVYVEADRHAEPPLFDPATAAVDASYGRIPERIRTWPGARHSGHPDDDGYGASSPYARLVQAGGEVLMLGAPLDTVTLLHHAEGIARAPGKRRLTYVVHTAAGPRSYTDIDTCDGAYPYERLGLDGDAFETIATAVAWLEARF